MCLFGACDAHARFPQFVKDDEGRVKYVAKVLPIFGSLDSSWWRFLCWQRWRNLLLRDEQDDLLYYLTDEEAEGFLQSRTRRLRRFHLLPSPLEKIYLCYRALVIREVRPGQGAAAQGGAGEDGNSSSDSGCDSG